MLHMFRVYNNHSMHACRMIFTGKLVKEAEVGVFPVSASVGFCESEVIPHVVNLKRK